jgi:hypothetical protein
LGLIDSGADVSVFSKEIAEVLDVDVHKGKPFIVNGFEGGEVPVWDHQVNIAVDGLGAIDTVVAFTDSDGPELSILGQRRFFDNYHNGTKT